jgi:hypothetical protein
MASTQRLLLINPRMAPDLWSLERIRPQMEGRAPMCNLALPTLAALTPGTWEVVLCDEEVQTLETALARGPFRVIGLTVHALQMARAVALLERLREETDALLVVGGPAVTLEPGVLRQKADVLFVGEAERTWPGFLRELAADRWQASYVEPEPADLREAPLPRIDLVSADAYVAGIVQTGRGRSDLCPRLEPSVLRRASCRTKPEARIVLELEAWYRGGYRMAWLADEDFFADREHAAATLASIRDWQQTKPAGEKLALFAEGPLDLVSDPSLVKLAGRAHLAELRIELDARGEAVEGGAGRSPAEWIEAVHALQHSGLIVSARSLLGLGGQGPDAFSRQFERIQAAGIPLVMCSPVYALPGTLLDRHLEQRLRPGASGAVAPAFDQAGSGPRSMSHEALMRGHRWLIEELYKPEHFLARLEALLANLPPEQGERSFPCPWQISALAIMNLSFRDAGSIAQEIRQTIIRAIARFPSRAASFALMFLYFRDAQIMLEQPWSRPADSAVLHGAP